MAEHKNHSGKIINVWETGWILVRSDDGNVESLVRIEKVEGEKKPIVGDSGSIQYRDSGVCFVISA